MPKIPKGMMGYDRAITVFSPDGRLLQVEYAKKTVKQGTTAVGVKCEDSVVLVADKRVIGRLVVAETIRKIFPIDDYIGGTMSGLVGDGRVLIEKAQEIAQDHQIKYGERIPLSTLVREICDHKQMYTQYAGTRPYGVSLLLAGVDDDGEPRLFKTEPSGTHFEYRATAIGDGSDKVKEFLNENWEESLSQKKGIKLGIKALKDKMGDDFSKKRIDIGIATAEGFRILSKEEKEEYLVG